MGIKLVLSLLSITLISVILAYTLPGAEFIRGIAVSPAIVALLTLVVQTYRDHNRKRHDFSIQDRANVFSLGATSHMANVAFDKHVEFCEEYMSELTRSVETLYRHGPTSEVLEHSANFSRLREQYSAWITKDLSENLLAFEAAIRQLGAEHGFIENTNGIARYERQRSEALSKSYEYFKRILSIENDGAPDPEIAIESVKERVREILGIEDLVQIRNALIAEARNRTKE